MLAQPCCRRSRAACAAFLCRSSASVADSEEVAPAWAAGDAAFSLHLEPVLLHTDLVKLELSNHHKRDPLALLLASIV